jgi:6-phosphogluconolactonase
MREIKIFSDRDQLFHAAAAHVAQTASEAIQKRGRFSMALSGGSTPKPVYAKLAKAEYSSLIDWSRVHIFWGDERCVAPDDPQSNYRMARETLLDRVPIPQANIHRIHGESEPLHSAQAYVQELQSMFGGQTEQGGPPPSGLDLILLGMGDDGHTASLFPGSAAIAEQKRWVMAQYVEVFKMWRITLTPVFINTARNITFIVSGQDKAARLREVLEGPPQPMSLPAQAIRPTQGRLLWLVDKAAASGL